MYFVFFIIFLLCLGGLGGSFQPSRLLILMIPLFLNVFINKTHLSYNKTIQFGLKTYCIWLVYGVITLFWSADPVAGLNSELIVMAIGMLSLLFFPLLLKNDKKSLLIIRNGWILGLCFTIPFAIYEIVTMTHFAYSEEDRLIGGIGIYAPFAAVFFGNYNNYCVYICLCLPMIFWALMDDKNKVRKILYMILLGVSILIIFINTNRTSMVVVAIYFLSLLRLKARNIFAVLGLTALFLVSYKFLPNNITDNIEILFNNRVNVDYNEDTSANIRKGVFLSGIDFLFETNGFGVGAGAFETHMAKAPRHQGIINPHNFFLEIVSQYGIFIFLLFVIWLFLIMRKIYTNSYINSSLKRIFYASVIVIPIIGVINSDSLGFTYWWVYISSLAVISSIDLNTIKNDSEYK
ncbi:O-antigen ligase family protein [Chryseobacterium sp. PET-29]|uniref:O-antigen ligase family protein n=1 Tax=Chryseobacterium sp. PET-29 TaxID=2983267 RepID=UPI0021E5DE41|nr:O-antigen ligase family protein [Chryseobacterium sp. PET-29]